MRNEPQTLHIKVLARARPHALIQERKLLQSHVCLFEQQEHAPVCLVFDEEGSNTAQLFPTIFVHY